MNFLQFLRPDVDQVMSQVNAQKGIADGLLSQIRGFIPIVSQAWVGGDEKEFEADVMRKLVPAMQELILAIAGINVNLTKATSIIDQADSKVKGMAGQLGDVFGKI